MTFRTNFLVQKWTNLLLLNVIYLKTEGVYLFVYKKRNKDELCTCFIVCTTPQVNKVTRMDRNKRLQGFRSLFRLSWTRGLACSTWKGLLVQSSCHISIQQKQNTNVFRTNSSRMCPFWWGTRTNTSHINCLHFKIPAHIITAWNSIEGLGRVRLVVLCILYLTGKH